MSCLLSASPPASVDTIQICAAALLHSGNRAIQQIAADLVTIGLVHGRAGLLECSHVHIVDDGAAAIFHLGEHIGRGRLQPGALLSAGLLGSRQEDLLQLGGQALPEGLGAGQGDGVIEWPVMS